MVKNALVALAFLFSIHAALADDMAHYPLEKPQKQSWSFSGPLGTYDKAQLQRGLKVYKEVCSTCHGLKYVHFRDLKSLGYFADDIKAFAAQYQINDGPNEEGEMFTRPGQPTDAFPSPYSNDKFAAFANNGVVPVDLSLVAKARAVPDEFPGFIMDIFNNYTAAGPDYIFNLLTGYRDAPEGREVSELNYYNPYFISGDVTAMAQPLYDDMVVYEDGTAQTAEQYARDVSAFLMWAADPHMEIRKQTGMQVMLFLIVFAVLCYMVKRRIWSELDEEEPKIGQ